MLFSKKKINDFEVDYNNLPEHIGIIIAGIGINCLHQKEDFPEVPDTEKVPKHSKSLPVLQVILESNI